MAPIIHIAPDISYLFPETASRATVLCGRRAEEIFQNGEFVGVKYNLNPDCEVCVECRKATNSRLLLALKALRADYPNPQHRYCWCGMAVGDPNYRGHTAACDEALAAVEEAEAEGL